MGKGQKPSWTFIFGIVIQVFFASVQLLTTREVAFRKDELDLNYTSLLKKCKKLKLPNGTMIQTVPVLVQTPLVTACSGWKSKYGPQLTQAVCRFPGCYSNPCQHGRCEDTLQGYQCLCFPGFHGKHCAGPKVFVTDQGAGAIFISELRDELNFTSIPSTSSPAFMKYDSVERYIYWSDWDERRVYRANVDGTDQEQVTAVGADVPYGIAIAERSRIIYIAYRSANKVTSMSIERGSPLPGIETDFVNQGIPSPRALTIDEEEGYLYISRHHGIVRALLNATNAIEEIYHNTDLQQLNGLSIDLTRNPRRIFFCDWKKKRTLYKEVSSLHNYDPSSAVELTNYMQNPYQEDLRDVSYFNGTLYWVRRNAPKGIGIMTDYDQTNRSYILQEVSQSELPLAILIIFIER